MTTNTDIVKNVVANQYKQAKVDLNDFNAIVEQIYNIDLPNAIHKKFVIPYINDVISELKKNRWIKKPKTISSTRKKNGFECFIAFDYTDGVDKNNPTHVELVGVTYYVDITYDGFKSYFVTVQTDGMKKNVLSGGHFKSVNVATAIQNDVQDEWYKTHKLKTSSQEKFSSEQRYKWVKLKLDNGKEIVIKGGVFQKRTVPDPATNQYDIMRYLKMSGYSDVKTYKFIEGEKV